MNFQRFISLASAARVQSPIREATAIALQDPQMLSLATGWPNSKFFPFKQTEVVLQDGKKISLRGKEMESSLQYSATMGTPGLLKWIRILQKKYHSPPLMNEDAKDGHKLSFCVTTGSQEGLSKVMEMLVGKGDNVILDNPCYPGTLAMLRPIGCNLLPVSTDKHGMTTESLLKVLSKWDPSDAKQKHSDIPRVIYTIPNCGNPTGATATLQRKQEIYKIAQKYDLVIVEDDPYFFLQFNDLIPSYQSLDVEGRVLRSDSMSKVLSSGLRLGWVSGSHTFIERVILHQQATSMHASSFNQAIVAKLFEEWGLDGFENHIKQVQAFYESQRDIMTEAIEKWLPGLVVYDAPQGGMFCWIRVRGIEDTADLVQRLALQKKILLLPGSIFEVEEGKTSSYLRASYSFATKEEINQALSLLAELLREELKSSIK